MPVWPPLTSGCSVISSIDYRPLIDTTRPTEAQISVVKWTTELPLTAETPPSPPNPSRAERVLLSIRRNPSHYIMSRLKMVFIKLRAAVRKRKTHSLFKAMSRTSAYVNRHSIVIYLKQNKLWQLECAHFGLIKEESPSHILANYLVIRLENSAKNLLRILSRTERIQSSWKQTNSLPTIPTFYLNM